MKFQATINKIDDWAKKWRIKIKQIHAYYIHPTHPNCPPGQMGNVDLPQKNEVKYVGMHLVRRLT
jgi:sugar phosphate isomerase/epimerase